MPVSKNFFLLLGLIVLLAFFLRLHAIEEESFWSDEMGTVEHIAPSTLSAILEVILETEQQPPLYFILLHYWSEFLGVSEFTLRFFSLIFGVLSVIVLFLLGRELFNEKVALLSAALLAVSPVQILYSQEARGYSLFAFLTLCSFLFFVRSLKEPLLKNNIFYVFFTTLSMYTHYFTLFSVAIQSIIVLFWFGKEIKRKYVRILLLVSLLSLPSFYFLLQDALYIHSRLTAAYSALNIPLLNVLGVLWFVLPFVLLVVAGFFIKKYAERFRRISFPQNTFLFFLVVFFVVYFVALPKLVTPFFLTRFSLFLLPAGSLLIARGITLLQPRKKMLSVLVLVLLLFSLTLPFYYTSVKKEQWREAAHFVQENSHPQDIVLFDAPYVQRSFYYYYVGTLESIGLPLETPEENTRFFTSLTATELSQREGVWLVLSHNYRNGDQYKELLDASFHLALQKEFKGIKVYYYQ